MACYFQFSGPSNGQDEPRDRGGSAVGELRGTLVVSCGKHSHRPQAFGRTLVPSDPKTSIPKPSWFPLHKRTTKEGKRAMN